VIRPASICTLPAGRLVELPLSTSIACLLVEVCFALVARAYAGLGRDEPGRGLPRISHSAWMALKPLRIRPAPGRIGLRQTVQVGLAGGFFFMTGSVLDESRRHLLPHDGYHVAAPGESRDVIESECFGSGERGREPDAPPLHSCYVGGRTLKWLKVKQPKYREGERGWEPHRKSLVTRLPR
jgi:hypothetical protein